MYLFVYEVSLRDRSYNRLRHRAFHGEAVLGDEKLCAKVPQLFVMNLKIAVQGWLCTTTLIQGTIAQSGCSDRVQTGCIG